MKAENCNLHFEICPPSQIPLLQFEICILKSASSEPDLAFEMPAEAMHMLFGVASLVRRVRRRGSLANGRV